MFDIIYKNYFMTDTANESIMIPILLYLFLDFNIVTLHIQGDLLIEIYLEKNIKIY